MCILMALLWSAGCNRQHNQQPVSAVTTAAAASPAATTNPEPPPVQATLPSEPPQPAPAPSDPAVVIPGGTRIHVRLGKGLDTKYTRPGQRFTAYLDAPITSGDHVVVPKGTAFEGRVIEARSSGRLKGRAMLGITLDSFRLHGATYRIATGADFRSSKSHKRRNLAIIGGGSGGGAAIGGVAGGGVGALIGAGAGAAAGTTAAFITGKKNVRLPAETPLVFSLHKAVTVRG